MYCKTLQLGLHAHVREIFFMRNMLNVQYSYVDKQQIKHVNLIAHATFFHFLFCTSFCCFYCRFSCDVATFQNLKLPFLLRF